MWIIDPIAAFLAVHLQPVLIGFQTVALDTWDVLECMSNIDVSSARIFTFGIDIFYPSMDLMQVQISVRRALTDHSQRHPTRMWGALVEIYCRLLAIIFDSLIVSFRLYVTVQFRFAIEIYV